jgi:hypothetical protein
MNVLGPTFKCEKCYKNILLGNKLLHISQCKAVTPNKQLNTIAQCPLCKAYMNLHEIEDHLFCHSLENDLTNGINVNSNISQNTSIRNGSSNNNISSNYVNPNQNIRRRTNPFVRNRSVDTTNFDDLIRELVNK